MCPTVCGQAATTQTRVVQCRSSQGVVVDDAVCTGMCFASGFTSFPLILVNMLTINACLWKLFFQERNLLKLVSHAKQLNLVLLMPIKLVHSVHLYVVHNVVKLQLPLHEVLHVCPVKEILVLFPCAQVLCRILQL